jgi:hypothetical protein
MTDSVTISNSGSTSNLTNLNVTIQWSDQGAATTSDYRPAYSDSRCTVSSGTTLTCSTPKGLGPGESTTYDLVFRTATNAAATSTTLNVTASAKEQAPPKKNGTTNVAFVNQSNPTPYEDLAELDVSAAGQNIAVTLGTSSSGGQSSKLPVPASGPRSVYELSEEGYPAGFCPAGLTCFGQHVTTTATGLSPVNLQITFTGILPAGVNTNSLVVVHLREGATQPTEINADCGGALFSGEPANFFTNFPNGCRRVQIDHLSGGIDVVQVDAWDISNGGWGTG